MMIALPENAMAATTTISAPVSAGLAIGHAAIESDSVGGSQKRSSSRALASATPLSAPSISDSMPWASRGKREKPAALRNETPW